MNSFTRLFKNFPKTIRTTLFPEQFFMGYSWQRVPNTLYVMKTAPQYSLLHLFKFCSTLLSCFLQPLPQLLFLISCFFDWLGDRATFDMLFHLMILWIYKCRALVPQYHNNLDMYSMQQDVKFTEVWHIIWFFASTLIWYHTHIHTKIHSTLRPIDWCTHISIHLHHRPCAQSSCLYYTE